MNFIRREYLGSEQSNFFKQILIVSFNCWLFYGIFNSIFFFYFEKIVDGQAVVRNNTEIDPGTL